MLILTRRVGEAAVIDTPDGPMRVVVIAIKGKQVRLGFKGSLRVNREEIPADPNKVWPQGGGRLDESEPLHAGSRYKETRQTGTPPSEDSDGDAQRPAKELS